MDTISLPRSNAETAFRVLQITDTHLFAQPDRTLLGVNTRSSFNAVLEAIVAQQREYDFVLFTGDISQDYSPASYRYFASRIGILGKKVFFLPGNHDDGPLMYKMFGALGVNTERQIRCGRWRFVMLNSEVYAVPHGWLQRDQLDFLTDCVREDPDFNTCVCVHHLPRPVGSEWLDTQTMHNSAEFLDCVRGLPNIRLILTGHVHQDYDVTDGGLRFIATPSTSIQFAPRSREFRLDDIGPGWRYLTFHDDGRVDSELCRLPQGLFRPRFNSSGY